MPKDIEEHITRVHATTSLGYLWRALDMAHNAYSGNNNMEKIYAAATEHINKTHSIRLELRFHELDTETGNLIQKINQFESELNSLKTHLTMIEGAIQTCTYFLTGKEEEVDNEVAVKS